MGLYYCIIWALGRIVEALNWVIEESLIKVWAEVRKTSKE
jgi:hypothetical protein